MENIVNFKRKEVKTINIKRKFDISFILILLISIILSRNQICLATDESVKFSSKSCYFYVQILGNGKVTKRKIQITLNSTDARSSQTASIKQSSISGYSNNHSLSIINSTTETKLAVNNYSIVEIQFSYKKPAHYKAKGNVLDKVENYRFNFRKYRLDNTGDSTVNNTGHNAKDTTETFYIQINLANCGIKLSNNDYNSTNATAVINLEKDYYSLLKIDPNGGTHNGNNKIYDFGSKICETTVKIQNPTKSGYEFIGWTLSKGSYCTGATFNFSTNQFTYCGKSTTTTNISDDNTCILKANWKTIYGTITIKPIDMENNMLNTGQYSLYDSSGNLLQTLSIEKNGQIMFTDLQLSKYIIYEDKIQKGYELSKIIEQEITETNSDIILEIVHKEKEVLPEAGGKPKDLIFISNGIILIIILNKKRRKI